jgi:quinol monooxygenase YgiN
MFKVIIRMKALPEKLKELTQTLAALVKSVREVQGCRSCDFCCSPEDESELCLFEEWECGEELNNHMRSEHFKVLLGARSLLKAPHEVKVYHEVKPGTDALAT